MSLLGREAVAVPAVEQECDALRDRSFSRGPAVDRGHVHLEAEGELPLAEFNAFQYGAELLGRHGLTI
jgi:hypothetical protein